MNPDTGYLFDEFEPFDWREHWVGMPEFVQERQEPFSEIIVRFEKEADLIEFSEIIGQKLTAKTKSIWHPFKSHWRESQQPIWRKNES